MELRLATGTMGTRVRGSRGYRTFLGILRPGVPRFHLHYSPTDRTHASSPLDVAPGHLLSDLIIGSYINGLLKVHNARRKLAASLAKWTLICPLGTPHRPQAYVWE